MFVIDDSSETSEIRNYTHCNEIFESHNDEQTAGSGGMNINARTRRKKKETSPNAAASHIR